MKTRQQRLAEEWAGHPPSPPQSLPVNQHGPRRARSKTPSPTVAAGSVVPATQPAVLEEPQALLRVWVDTGPGPSGRDPTHEMMFSSTHLPTVVAFLNNISSESNDNPPQHGGIEEQETEEPIEPEKSEPVAAGKPAKRRKNAFRRNPKMGIPAGLLASTSAANNIPMIFRDDFDFAANEPRYTGECTMNDVSETGSTIGQSAVPSIQVAASEVNLAPQTLQGSKWSLGSLYQSACSVTRRLVFSPLASVLKKGSSGCVRAMVSSRPSQNRKEENEGGQNRRGKTVCNCSKVEDTGEWLPINTFLVPESHESFSHTATISAPQAVTESTAPAAPKKPKKQSSAPSSARDKRAKSRQHDAWAVNPVITATTSTNQGHRQLRAKKVKPASEDTEATGVQGNEFPPRNGRHPDTGEVEAQQAGAAEPIVGQNIRWPSRWLDRWNANKRKRDGDPIDAPGEAGDGGNTEEQPGKTRRTREPGVSSGQQPPPMTPIPITNREGTFKVPSPGDSYWSDSGSEEEEANNAGLEGINPSRALRPAEAAALRKARDNSQKYKPPKSSRLCYSSSAYPSPPPVVSRRQTKPCPLLAGDPEKREPRHQAATKPSTPTNLEPSGHIKNSPHLKIGAKRHLRRYLPQLKRWRSTPTWRAMQSRRRSRIPDPTTVRPSTPRTKSGVGQHLLLSLPFSSILRWTPI